MGSQCLRDGAVHAGRLENVHGICLSSLSMRTADVPVLARAGIVISAKVLGRRLLGRCAMPGAFGMTL